MGGSLYKSFQYDVVIISGEEPYCDLRLFLCNETHPVDSRSKFTKNRMVARLYIATFGKADEKSKLPREIVFFNAYITHSL